MDQGPNEYLRNAILTANPEQLLLMLYDGAIRFTRQGIEGAEKRNWEQAFTGYTRAQKIVLELIGSLNYDVDERLCTTMAGLYKFVYRRLVEAGMSRDPAAARDALKILEYQRETWILLIDKLRKEPASPLEPEIPAPSRTFVEEPVYGTLSVHG